MRQQKIRGFNRRFRNIEIWRLRNLELRLDLIEKYHREFTEIMVHPWCDISIINSKIPDPKRTTKTLMLSGLLDIYESWKVQLDKLNKPYYLKIWLYEPRFSKSQVVCAIADKIEFYENNFFNPNSQKEFKPTNYGKLIQRLGKYGWEYRLDEDHYDNCIIGEPDEYATLQDYQKTKKWFKRLMKKPHRLYKFDEPIDNATELYSFKRGDLWIGEKNKNAS